MLIDANQLQQLYDAMHEGRRIRIRLDDGRSGKRSARTFLGVPTGIGPWGVSNEPHVVIQMLGARGTMVSVAVQLGRVVAVDTDV
jgi:hypothetical protein